MMTTICDKINTVGTILQENLNDRGVSCTFGLGTGESTVLDMVGLVNGTNFKGSSDVNLKIGANRPYLLENETTDVVVKLENGLCEPLKNKNVIVGQSVFRDGGVTGNKNTNYTTGSALTISTTTESTSVSSTSSNSTTGRYKGDTAITGDFELIADVKLNQAYSSTVGLYFGVYNDDYTIFRIKTQEYVKVKIKRENGVYTVQTSTDGTTWTDGTFQQDRCTGSSVYPVLYVYNNTGSSNGLSYKNLVLNNTLTGVTDGKGEFALYDVSVTDDTTFTATYGTETATTNVYLCQFVDYGVTNNNNNNWSTWSTYTVSRTRSAESTLIEPVDRTTASYQIKYINNISPSIIEFDCCQVGGATNNIIFQLRGNNQSVIRQIALSSYTNLSLGEWYHWKVDLVNGKFTNETTNQTLTFSTGSILSFFFVIQANAQHNLKYKNFVIY